MTQKAKIKILPAKVITADEKGQTAIRNTPFVGFSLNLDFMFYFIYFGYVLRQSLAM